MRELTSSQIEAVSGGMSLKSAVTIALTVAVCPPVAIGMQVGYVANKNL